MKINWGTGILVFIVFFILVNIAFFIFINTLDINLVEDNYYEKELAYQEKIDKIENSRNLTDRISIISSKENISIIFPSITKGKSPGGIILFFRPSDPALDITIPLSLNDSSIQIIPTDPLQAGRYIVKIDWLLNGVEYYHEESIVIESGRQ